jgi:hypothetical protein
MAVMTGRGRKFSPFPGEPHRVKAVVWYKETPLTEGVFTCARFDGPSDDHIHRLSLTHSTKKETRP